MTPMAIFAGTYALMGLGMFLVAISTGPWGVFGGILVMGLGMGPGMPNYTTYFMSEVPPALRGRASGMLTTTFFAGQFASPLVSAPLVGQFGLVGAFQILAAAMVVLSIGLAVAALRQRRLAAA